MKKNTSNHTHSHNHLQVNNTTTRAVPDYTFNGNQTEVGQPGVPANNIMLVLRNPPSRSESSSLLPVDNLLPVVELQSHIWCPYDVGNASFLFSSMIIRFLSHSETFKPSRCAI